MNANGLTFIIVLAAITIDQYISSMRPHQAPTIPATGISMPVV